MGGEVIDTDQLPGPIFIVADDEREACGEILRQLYSEWFFIPVYEPRLVVRYAQRLATTAVLLADPINFPQGGSARLLQKLLDEVGKPVVIMTETWEPRSVDRWKQMGAHDCIPHPTRTGKRMEALRTVVQKFGLEALATARQVGKRTPRAASP